MSRDVAGISRVNMFERTGHYTPVSGNGTRITYETPSGQRFDAPNRRMTAEELAYYDPSRRPADSIYAGALAPAPAVPQRHPESAAVEARTPSSRSLT